MRWRLAGGEGRSGGICPGGVKVRATVVRRDPTQTGGQGDSAAGLLVKPWIQIPGSAPRPLRSAAIEARGPAPQSLSGQRLPPRLRPNERPARMYGGAFFIWGVGVQSQAT
jgi:hypothetical protein